MDSGRLVYYDTGITSVFIPLSTCCFVKMYDSQKKQMLTYGITLLFKCTTEPKITFLKH